MLLKSKVSGYNWPMDTKFLIVGNWKMNPKTSEQAQKIFSEIKKHTKKFTHVETVICPSFIHVGDVKKLATSHCKLGCQDCYPGTTGSNTGQVSVAQIKDAGASYCIVGHSYVRGRGETDAEISEKIKLLVRSGITPILCVGEHDRDTQGAYLSFVENQIQSSLSGISKNMASKVVIAYEPLWAIGTKSKRIATTEEIEEMFILIQRTLTDMYSLKGIPKNTLLYGGSVSNSSGVTNILTNTRSSGCLVGRASLASTSFVKILQAAQQVEK